MNAKWCVGTLIIVLALLGLDHEQKRASNQQILVQFADAKLASETAHDDVLTAITKKLRVLGVDDIEIIKSGDGQVNILYYSNIEARRVKEFLSDENELLLTYEDELPSNAPKEDFPEGYSLIVADLHQQAHHGLNVKGNFVPIQKEGNDGVSNPVVLQFGTTIALPNSIEKVALKVNGTIVLAIANTSRHIPEVRAGPYTLRNS